MTDTKLSTVLDLDAEVRPASEVKPPFVVALGGREITLRDPSEIDWRDLVDLEDGLDVLRVAMSPEDREFLAGQEIEAWRFNRLVEAYHTHYNLDELTRKAERRRKL